MSDGGHQQRAVSKRFSSVEDELRKETSVIGLMKEQWVGMAAMAGMFIITIALGLYIRPYYDVGELHAFGESGASQVRYIFIELVAIFAFTALIIFLARRKKELFIKYGMMIILAIALLYSTVPLAHMLMIDFEPEPFLMSEQSTSDGEYLGSWGEDGFISSHIEPVEGFIQVTLQGWNGGNMYSEPVWEYELNHSQSSDFNPMYMTHQDGTFVMSSGEKIWVFNEQTAVIEEEFACYWIDDNGVANPHNSTSTACASTARTEDALYVLNEVGELFRFNTDETPGGMYYQAKWVVANLSFADGVVHSQLLSDDAWLIATKNRAMIIKLESSSGFADPLLGTPMNASLYFDFQPGSSITDVELGPSPYSEANISMSMYSKQLILLSQSDGTVHGFEWDSTAALSEKLLEQTRMHLSDVVEHVTSISINDLDENGESDLLLSGTDETHFLYSTSMIDRGQFPVVEGRKTFFHLENDSAYIVTISNDVETNQFTIHTGELTWEMFPLYGLQLETIPTVIGLVVTTVLMILLFVHSEWYVVNTTGILLGAGVVVMLGVTFVPPIAIIFMIAAAVYDAWAVYKSKHMLDLADTIVGLRLPMLLVAPQEKGYSLIQETSAPIHSGVPTDDATPMASPSLNNNKPASSKGSEAMLMGLGDVIFPGMLVVSAMQWLEPNIAFNVAIATLLGGLLGYLILISYVARGKAQAGLPLLNGGAIIGYIIGGLLFIGTEIFRFNISW